MPPSETFAKDILQHEFDIRVDEFNKLSQELSNLRNHIAICTSKSNYECMESDRTRMEQRRRELRGEMSALRQAIAKLGEKDG